jgi:hypothetical protein
LRTLGELVGNVAEAIYKNIAQLDVPRDPICGGDHPVGSPYILRQIVQPYAIGVVAEKQLQERCSACGKEWRFPMPPEIKGNKVSSF